MVSSLLPGLVGNDSEFDAWIVGSSVFILTVPRSFKHFLCTVTGVFISFGSLLACKYGYISMMTYGYTWLAIGACALCIVSMKIYSAELPNDKPK
jgi:hypothetical protein